ncbi:hypothetical protein IDJ75_10615 [Mucilaginibacter rigui]|uniref:Uncharacterized protein n=1 Tax=Mucilaginibacter rigui TaxID=534635 RepID=A0ABR7X574_9SPHI|nr:hypothetical protein [Mucilaginibacter rigui]MBD1385731.1 hypothetical protein [Mucilaginibacter rigui]
MIKSTKRFILTTDAVNSYSFRVLTAGIDLTQFKSNPLMLWMHRRANGSSRDEVLPLGYWDDLQVTENSISGVPVFDDSDLFAMSIYNKVENGTIKMASAGLKPVEWNDSQQYKLPGQTAATLMRSIMEEVSLCDIGANSDAIAVTLYSNNGGVIQLSTLGALNDPYILKLAAKSWEELDKAGEMKALKAAAPDMYAKKFHERFGKYPDGYTAPANLSMDSNGHTPRALFLAAKSWDELHRSTDLAELKRLSVDLYNHKFYEHFGEMPKSVTRSTKTVLSHSVSQTLTLSQILDLDCKSWDELDRSNELLQFKQAAPQLFASKFFNRFGKMPSN